MAKKKRRQKTDYPGVYFEEVPSRANPKKMEKSFIISYRWYNPETGKKDLLEERVGRSSPPEAWTPAQAYSHRQLILEGKEDPAKIKREKEKREKANSISGLWKMYLEAKGEGLKGRYTDDNRFKKWIEPSVGNKQLKDVVPMDVTRIRTKMTKLGRKPQTIKHVTQLLVRISNYAIDELGVSGLQFKIKHPRFDNRVTECLTTEQYKALLKACDKEVINPDVARLMKLALFTGMRRGELVKLRWEDVDFDRQFIHIRNPKGIVHQTIPMSESAASVLMEQQQPRYDNSELVFPGKDGKQRVDLRRTVRRIAKAAGLPKGFRPLHGLRHTFGTEMAASGEVSSWELQRLMTHKSPRMTDRYVHIANERLKKAASVQDKILERVVNGD